MQLLFILVTIFFLCTRDSDAKEIPKEFSKIKQHDCDTKKWYEDHVMSDYPPFSKYVEGDNAILGIICYSKQEIRILGYNECPKIIENIQVPNLQTGGLRIKSIVLKKGDSFFNRRGAKIINYVTKEDKKTIVFERSYDGIPTQYICINHKWFQRTID